MPRLSKIFLAALLLSALTSTVVLAAKVYKWKDAHGVMHYSRTPPPDAQAESLDIHVREDPGALKRLEQQKARSSEYFKQREEARKAAKQKAGEQARIKAACDNARQRLTGLQQSQRIYKTDAAGERVRIGEEERQARIKQVREDIAKYCK